MEGASVFGNYDSVSHADWGNLTMNDIVVSKNGKIGLYVEGRGEIIPPLYEGLRRFWNHIYVFSGDKTGLYDDDGNMLFPAKYRSINIAYPNPKTNFYLVKTMSGGTMIMGEKGKVILPAGHIDRADFIVGDDGKWCTIYKNGKMGIMNLQSGRIALPCVYEDKIFFGNGTWPNRKIGVYRTASTGELIEIWTLSGKKLSSKAFPRSAKYSMKHYLENHLNVSLYYDY